MKKLIHRKLLILSVTVLFVLPLLSLAANPWGTPPKGMSDTVGISDITRSITGKVMLVIGGICVLMIVVGGVIMATSSGNENARKRGLNTLIWAIIGLIIAILAWTIVAIIGGEVSGF